MVNESLKIQAINYQNLKSTTSGIQNSEIELLDNACKELGFFHLVNHGLEDHINQLFTLAQTFFDQPQNEKEKVPRENRYGYVPNAREALNMRRKTGNAEFVDLGLSDEIQSLFFEKSKQQIQEYQQQGLIVASELLKVLGAKLGVNKLFFEEKMNNPQCRLRFLHYSPLNHGNAEYPLGAHTDYGLITLLATDGVPGLEIQKKDGEWLPVDTPKGSLIVNLGDMLARWTNDRYCSTPHRARLPKQDSRYSIPFFINPDPTVVIEVIDSCVSDGNLNRYEPI
ncbi:MAG: 2OG-Fe(II) oxygenase family protein, partial [Actinomycetota bacterium]